MKKEPLTPERMTNNRVGFRKEIEVMPHLKEKYSFFKGEVVSPKQMLYNNRSMESRVNTDKIISKDELDIDIAPKKKKTSKSKEKYNILTNA